MKKKQPNVTFSVLKEIVFFYLYVHSLIPSGTVLILGIYINTSISTELWEVSLQMYRSIISLVGYVDFSHKGR